MRSKFPSCKFVGVDPSYEAGKIFEKIGQFLNIGIGRKDQQQVETPILNDNLSITNYVIKNVSSWPLEKVLQEFHTTDIIDFLFVDAEGAEYNLIPEFTK